MVKVKMANGTGASIDNYIKNVGTTRYLQGVVEHLLSIADQMYGTLLVHDSETAKDYNNKLNKIEKQYVTYIGFLQRD